MKYAQYFNCLIFANLIFSIVKNAFSQFKILISLLIFIFCVLDRLEQSLTDENLITRRKSKFANSSFTDTVVIFFEFFFHELIINEFFKVNKIPLRQLFDIDSVIRNYA